jgi:phosphatidylglycerophosphate synthase
MDSGNDDRSIGFLAFGGSGVRVFGLDPATRANRYAARARLGPLDRVAPGGAVIVADLGFAWDPAWLAWLRTRPGTVVTLGGRPALAHLATAGPVAIDTLQNGIVPASLVAHEAETGSTLYNATLRKREQAYLLPLDAAGVDAIERASYDASYKGVTDLLTLYLWRGVAFHVTRWAAAARLTPNMVTLGGIVLCVLAFLLFLGGHYLAGLAIGLVFMVLDTVDGKLARCTGTSSEWGNLLDHGVDLVHPPFWYWAWGTGLAAWGLGWSPARLWTVMAVLIAGYVVQRLIEGAFIAWFGMHIHVWRQADSRFRLVTARRNPNWLILLAGTIALRPDWGLLAVAGWTVVSCLFHLVRLVQASVMRARGLAIVSWLA